VDAIVLLKNDHKTVEKLFKQFEKAGDDAPQKKRDLVDQIIEELSVHAYVEEQVFYPEARKAVPETEDHVLESLEEHHIVKWVLQELQGMDPADERFDAKVSVLIENVRHHVEEEEQDWFPKVRKAMGRKRLQELAERLEETKKAAPRTPLPQAQPSPGLT
jgi:hemerythrin superfamily protein